MTMSPTSLTKPRKNPQSILLKSLEKDALYLAERFGHNLETLDKRKIDEQVS